MMWCVSGLFGNGASFCFHLALTPVNTTYAGLFQVYEHFVCACGKIFTLCNPVLNSELYKSALPFEMVLSFQCY